MNIHRLNLVRVIIVVCICFVFQNFVHPYYISNTDLNYKTTSKSVEVICRIFTDNLEDALQFENSKSINLLQPKNKQEINDIVCNYINQHFSLSINKKQKKLIFIGYERIEDAVWIYFEATQEEPVKEIEITNSILYAYHREQMNMVHYSENGVKKSSKKVVNPDCKLNFFF